MEHGLSYPQVNRRAGLFAIGGFLAESGAVLNSEGPLPQVDSQARGKVATLVDAVLDGPRVALEAEGDAHLIKTCLERLQSTLWAVWAHGSPARAEAVGGGSEWL